jgi:hypothetical protein
VVQAAHARASFGEISGSHSGEYEDDCFLGYCAVYDRLALMMEEVNTSETIFSFYQTTRRNIPEDCHLHVPALVNILIFLFHCVICLILLVLWSVMSHRKIRAVLQATSDTSALISSVITGYTDVLLKSVRDAAANYHSASTEFVHSWPCIFLIRICMGGILTDTIAVKDEHVVTTDNLGS